jgi:hypothetical protein
LPNSPPPPLRLRASDFLHLFASCSYERGKGGVKLGRVRRLGQHRKKRRGKRVGLKEKGEEERFRVILGTFYDFENHTSTKKPCKQI